MNTPGPPVAAEGSNLPPERHIINLASMKPSETLPPRISATPILQQAVGAPHGLSTVMTQPITRVLVSTTQSIQSIPVAMTTSNLVAIGSADSQTQLKQGGPSSTLPMTATTTLVARPIVTTTLPLQSISSHIPVSANYHVPRGAAAVANMSAPRSAVATPIVRVTSNQPPGPVTSHPSFVSSLRGMTPRTLTPVVGTTWLSSPSNSSLPRATVFTQGRPTSMTVTTRPLGIQVSRMQTEPLKQQLLHSPGLKPITVQQSTAPQVQLTDKNFFKTTMAVQSSLGPVTIAQLLPARQQGVSLAYTNPLTNASASYSLTSAGHQLVQTSTPGAPRQNVLTSTQVRHLAPPNRIAVSTQAVVTSVPGAIVAVANPQCSRITALPSTLLSAGQTSAILTAAPSRHARLAVAQSLPRATIANPTVIATIGNTVINSPARITAASSGPMHQSTLLTAQVITQPGHGPSIQLAQVPASSFAGKLPVTLHGVMPLQQTTLAITTTSSSRPASHVSAPALAMSAIRPLTSAPPARVYSQQEISLPVHALQQTQQNILQGTNIYIQATHKQATGTNSNPVYFYESASYPVSGIGGSLVARPFQPTTSTAFTVQAPTLQAHQVHGTTTIMTSGAPIRFNPVMVMETTGSTTMPVHSYLAEGNLLQSENVPVPASPNHNQTLSKPVASPRPSILRKRDNEGSPLKAQKNLAPVLAAIGGASGPSSPPSPRRPDSRDNGGGSSNGSTTISATSSPGLGEAGDDSQPASIKQEVEEGERPPVEMSPRKKPRKQQLAGNDLHGPQFSKDDMEFITEETVRKDLPDASEDYREAVCIPKRPKVSLKSSYRHTWKSQHNHFVHYDNVRVKEVRPTINDLANQKGIIEKLNGWKIFHLSTQMEEMSDLESNVVERLTSTLKIMELKTGKDADKDVNRINELIKGNIQRSKVIKDQMQDALSQVMKIFEHKEHVSDILNRCANKRSFKKREKS